MSFKLANITEVSENGLLKVLFDGEDVPSEKEYKYLKSYTPSKNDRVVLVSVESDYIVLGAIQAPTE